MPDPDMSPDTSLTDFLVRNHLAQANEPVQWRPLTGGVSSDIWQVDLPGRSLCVKRALAQLKVSATWLAPVNRNAYEWAWMNFAIQHCPESVPRPLAHDEAEGLFAMSFLEPEVHPVWKHKLMAGDVRVETAQAVGDVLGRLHAASACSAALADAFETLDNFYALRLEPYLVATATRHPAQAAALVKLVARTAGTRRVLVHGDVSPKNILVGPRGPVLLDAECAWFGDPAFDLAFCLNHLLLKCLVQSSSKSKLLASFDSLARQYLSHVNWEQPASVERRAAHLLPALLLARVDGKSPVEYVSQEEAKRLVREVSLPLIDHPVDQLATVAQAWSRALE